MTWFIRISSKASRWSAFCSLLTGKITYEFDFHTGMEILKKVREEEKRLKGYS